MTFTGRQLGRSLAWSGAGAALMRVGQVMVGIVAARLLTPEDFGLFAVTIVVYSVIASISDLGVGSAVVREHKNLDEIAPTAVTLSLVSTAGLGLVMWLAAPQIASVLAQPESARAIGVMSLVVVLAGPSAVPAALLTRNFRQDLRFRADLLNLLASTVILIWLALEGHGVMALAWSRVAGQTVSVAVLLWVAPARHRPGFKRASAVHLIRFGAPLVGSNLVGFTLSSLDSIVLARSVGATRLGIYTLANNVAGWPLAVVFPMLMNVGLPVLSRVRHDQDMLGRWLRASFRLLIGFFFFASAMIAALSGSLVVALYGDRWADAGPILAVLALYGYARAAQTILAETLVACNATSRLLWLNIVWIILLAPTLVLGTHWGGATGAAVAHVAVAFVVVLPLAVWFVRRVTGVRLGGLLKDAVFPVLTSTTAAAAAHYASRLAEDPWLALLIGGTAGVALYVLLMHRWLQKLATELRALVHRSAPPTAMSADAQVET